MKQKIISFIIAEASNTKRGKESPMLQLKSAPHYLEHTVPSQFILGSTEAEIDSQKVKLVAKTYHPDAILVECTLEVQFKYSQNDLVIADWDGAFLFDPDGEGDEALEIFEIANYQLLRYR